MYSTRPGLLVAFHGCDKAFRDQAIMGAATFRLSTALHEWLGHGIYFWENNQERALQYAEERRDRPQKAGPRIRTPAVLGAVLDLGNCFDLLDSHYLNLAKTSYENLQKAYGFAGQPLPVNRSPRGASDSLIRELDCAVFENIHREHTDQPFDSVRGMFVEGEQVYPGAGFNSKDHMQICIRNPNCIKGLFLPRKEVGWP